MKRYQNFLYVLGGLFFLCAPSPAHALAMSMEAKSLIYESYALEEKRDYGKAIEKVTKALSMDAEDYFLNFRLGWLFSLDKKYKNSITHYEKAAVASPKALEPLLSLSLLYFNLADFANAAATSERLLALDPSHYYGLLRAISSEIKGRKFPEALSHAQEAVKLYPTDTVFLEQKGFLEMNTGNAAQGKETLQRLLLVSPKNAYAKAILGAP